MELTLLVAVVGLFVAVLLLKTIVSLAVSYLLFVAVAFLVFVDRYGPELSAWLGAPEAAQIATIAAAAMIGTKLAAFALFRDSRWRFLLTPITGVALTALATRVVAG